MIAKLNNTSKASTMTTNDNKTNNKNTSLNPFSAKPNGFQADSELESLHSQLPIGIIFMKSGLFT